MMKSNLSTCTRHVQFGAAPLEYGVKKESCVGRALTIAGIAKFMVFTNI